MEVKEQATHLLPIHMYVIKEQIILIINFFSEFKSSNYQLKIRLYDHAQSSLSIDRQHSSCISVVVNRPHNYMEIHAEFSIYYY